MENIINQHLKSSQPQKMNHLITFAEEQLTFKFNEFG